MMTFSRRSILILVATSLILLTGLFFWLSNRNSKVEAPIVEQSNEPEIPVVEEKNVATQIGSSVEGRPIESYTYGKGERVFLFVGGMHGGYEWNSVLLAYQFIDELESGEFIVPENTTIKVTPVLNPDGLYKVVQKVGRFTVAEIPPNDAHQTGAGRFNANGVDLNRNFDCKWQPESTWRGKVVSAGAGVFSEPEALALKNFVAEINPQAVIFWHSQANNVYASECKAGVLPKTLSLMKAYAAAGKYGAVASFDAYPVTGDAEGWLASINIPAITVELESRTDTEWTRNRAGIEAILNIN